MSRSIRPENAGSLTLWDTTTCKRNDPSALSTDITRTVRGETNTEIVAPTQMSTNIA